MSLPYRVNVQDREGNLYSAAESIHLETEPVMGQLVTVVCYDENGMAFEVDGFIVDWECAI